MIDNFLLTFSNPSPPDSDNLSILLKSKERSTFLQKALIKLPVLDPFNAVNIFKFENEAITLSKQI